MSFKSNRLEKTLTRESYERIRDAVTSGWDREFVQDPANASAVDDVVFRRHDNTVQFVVPWVEAVRPLRDSRVLDFGCGCGSSSLAFARFSPEVVGLEIDTPSIDGFRTRMDVTNCTNATVSQHDPEQILESAIDEIRPGTTVLLLAVVEHLTEAERLDYLTRIWDALSPGDLLVVAETPNQYALFDGHTFGVPFAHLVPDAYFERWLESQEEGLRFRQDLLDVFENSGTDAALERRRRLGMGVSHHAFELAFGLDLREVVAADGFSKEIDGWFPISGEDRRLVSTFQELGVELPIGFARSVLSFVFVKPRSVSEAESRKKWNEKHRKKVTRRLLK